MEKAIILAEDNMGHARLIEKNLKRGGLQGKVTHFTDGRQVLDFLTGAEKKETEVKIDNTVVLLDLNMPIMNGFQVLQSVKSDPTMKSIHVVVMTTTDDPSEIQRCYDLGCDLALTKPVEYTSFAQTIQKLAQDLNKM
ncbi:MAG: response regulator [Anaerolineae bacterium]|nr:response regulator [Anaerolineae bacterium]MCA9888328.1 response regulator [Anaerolineae bacterium]MCA9892279.1 response regulator [Anaerolineae bacterium]MCB9460513.1 response regulator [Anaerolineaceae bacterium]